MFIVIVQSVMLVMHVVFFQSVGHFFRITTPLARTLWNGAGVVLSFCFLISFLLLRWRGWDGIVAVYHGAAVWTGCLIHFLTAVAAVWVVVLLGKCLGRPVHQPLAAGVFLSAAVLFSIYGLWNASHPRVREIMVALPHLPPQWEGRRLVHLTDLHLGRLNGRAFAGRIADAVNRLEPDIICITGDLLDGVNGRYAEVIEPINRLAAGRGVFFVTGNHEHYVGLKKAKAILDTMNLRVLDNEWLSVDGLELIGVSYPGIGGKEDIRNLPQDKAALGARILLFHTPTAIKRPDGDREHRHGRAYWTPETSFDLQKELGVGLQLSGHTHHGQIFPLQFLTRFLFNGHDYGLVQDGDFQIYTSCGTGTWGPPLRTAGIAEIAVIRLTRGR